MIPEGCCGCQWLESTKHQLGKLSAESSFPTVDSWRRSYLDGFLPDLHSMVQMEGVCVQAIWWLKECVYKLFGYWRSVCTSNLVVGRYVCVCVCTSYLVVGNSCVLSKNQYFLSSTELTRLRSPFLNALYCGMLSIKCSVRATENHECCNNMPTTLSSQSVKWTKCLQPSTQ